MTRRGDGPAALPSAAVKDLLGITYYATGDVSVSDLERALCALFKGLTKLVGDEKKARKILLESAPAERRRLFDALLPRAKRGRPPITKKTSRDAGRRYTLVTMYCWRKEQNPTLTIEKFAEDIYIEHGKAVGASPGAVNKRLRRALADRQSS
jgi:hypothetical protein